MADKKLFEFTATISYVAIIAAETEEAARAEIKTWENAWHDTGELLEVVDVDLMDVRDADQDCLDDLAHFVASGSLQDAPK